MREPDYGLKAEKARSRLDALRDELNYLLNELQDAAASGEAESFTEALTRRYALPFAVADAVEAEVEARLRAERVWLSGLRDKLQTAQGAVRRLQENRYRAGALPEQDRMLREAAELETELSRDVERAAQQVQQTSEEGCDRERT